MCTVHFEQVHLLHHLPFPLLLLPFQTVCGGFHYAGFVCLCLGWFHSLAIMNRAAIYMGMNVSLFYVDLHSSRYRPKSGMEGQKLSLFLGTFILISVVVALIYIPTNSV
jgi:hypothetical protein